MSTLFCTRSRRMLANCHLSILYCGRISNIAARNVVGSNVSIGRFGLIAATRPVFSLQCTP